MPDPTHPTEPDYVITLSRDGDSWCALIGADLQEGCSGFGATPGEAVRALITEMEASGAWLTT